MMKIKFGDASQAVQEEFQHLCERVGFSRAVDELLQFEASLPPAACFNESHVKPWSYTINSLDKVQKNQVSKLKSYVKRHRLASIASAVEQLFNVQSKPKENSQMIQNSCQPTAKTGLEGHRSSPVTISSADNATQFSNAASQKGNGENEKNNKRGKRKRDTDEMSDDNDTGVTGSGDHSVDDIGGCGGVQQMPGTGPRRSRRSCNRLSEIIATVYKPRKPKDCKTSIEEQAQVVASDTHLPTSARTVRKSSCVSLVSNRNMNILKKCSDDSLGNQKKIPTRDEDCSSEDSLDMTVSDGSGETTKEEHTLSSGGAESSVEGIQSNTHGSEASPDSKKQSASKPKKNRSQAQEALYRKRKVHAQMKIRAGRSVWTQANIDATAPTGEDCVKCLVFEAGPTTKVSRISNLSKASSQRTQTDVYYCFICDTAILKKNEYVTHFEGHKYVGNNACPHCCCIIENRDLFQSHMQYHQGRYHCAQCQTIFINRESIFRHFGLMQTLCCPVTDCNEVYYSCTKEKFFQHLKDHLKSVPQLLQELNDLDLGNIQTVTEGNAFPLWILMNVTGKVWGSAEDDSATVIAAAVQKEITDIVKLSFDKLKSGKSTTEANTITELKKVGEIAEDDVGARRDSECGSQEIEDNAGLANSKTFISTIQKNLKPETWYKSIDFELQGTKIIVTQKRQFECGECSKAFHSESGMLKHRAKAHRSRSTPTKEGSPVIYKCDLCEQVFMRKHYCIRHMQRVHKYDPVRPDNPRKYQCRKCSEKFSTPGEAHEHAKRFHKENCHQCPYCKYKTTFKGRLQAHIRSVHEKKVLHKCKICQKEFMYNSSFKIHMKYHNNIRQYACEVCKKQFLTKQQCLKHAKVHEKKDAKRPHSKQAVAAEVQEEVPAVLTNEQVPATVETTIAVTYEKEEHFEGIIQGDQVLTLSNNVIQMLPHGTNENGEQYIMITMPATNETEQSPE